MQKKKKHTAKTTFLLEKIWFFTTKYHTSWRHVRSHQKKPYKEFSDEYWKDLVDLRNNKVLKGIPLYQ